MRRFLLLLAMLCPFIAMATDIDPAPDTCSTLDACLFRLRELAHARPADEKYGGLPRDERALIARIVTFDQAVPALVPLLADPDTRIATLAAASLRDVARGIDPRYLPQITQGMDRKLNWLAPALGRIPTDAAAREAVERYLSSYCPPHNQEAYAVRLSGPRAIPLIVEKARCANGCAPETFDWLGSVLKNMKADRALAAPGLMVIVRDPSSPQNVVKGVLHMISALGPQGQGLEADLLQLREQRPHLSTEVDDALIGIRSTEAGAIYTRRLKAHPDHLILRDLAETGLAGRQAGAAVTALLDSDDRELRIAAARTLGFIGHADGAQALIALLSDTSDLRLPWVAAQSLGRLQARSALAALDHTARTYWYPPVRDAARIAAGHIRQQTGYVSRFSPQNFAFEFFGYQDIGQDIPACKPVAMPRNERPSEKLQGPESAAALKRLVYAAQVVGYGPAESDPTSAKGVIRVVTHSELVEHRQNVQRVPGVALRVADGWLTGSDQGEWGGELMFVGDRGARDRIASVNVKNIYRLGKRWIAVTGLAHIMISEGTLLEIKPTKNGRWQAVPWRQLPGAPGASFLTTGDELLVQTTGGTILIAPDGTMRMADCKEPS